VRLELGLLRLSQKRFRPTTRQPNSQSLMNCNALTSDTQLQSKILQIPPSPRCFHPTILLNLLGGRLETEKRAEIIATEYH
jgi:hypothetical protein